jgi:hypothetical protein
MTVLEDRIRNVLADQAAAMHVPDAGPAEPAARVTELPASSRRPRLLVAVAAAGLLVASGVALAQRRGADPVADEPASGSGFHFETPTVLLRAASVEVTVAGQTFVPTPDVRVEGDPGTPNEYTTLELTWHERGVEQRIFIYFASDGTNWWANEIRTYDGKTNGDWIEQQGKFFTTQLGGTYVGDLDLPNLKIRGMRLAAFRRPSSCDNPTSPLALVANYPNIDAGVGLYGATLQVVDTATCTPVPASGFTFEFTSENPAVATVQSPQEIIVDYPPTLARVGFNLVIPGDTTIHAVARDQGGTIVGTADMHVIVRPSDGTITADTQVAVATTHLP